MSSVQTTLTGARIEVDKTITNMNRLGEVAVNVEAILLRYLVLVRRVGLPDDLEAAITKAARMAVVLNSLRMTLLAVQAASGPIGWAMALAGAGATVMMTTDTISSMASP